MMPKFSANLGFLWPDRPLLDRIEAAAKAGFKAVELHWPYDLSPESVRDLRTRLGVELLGINTPLGDTAKGEFGLGAIAGREAEFDAHFRLTLDWGRRAGASAIHVMAGVVPPEQKAQARATLTSNLRRAAHTAPDITLLLEGLNPRDKPGYFYSAIAEKADVITAVGAPNLKIMFDAYHVGVSEGDIFTKLARYLPLIGHVQIAAVPSRAEPDEGEVAYGNFFRELDRLGYDGWVGCEYRPRGSTDDGLAWVKTLGVAL
jgi:hydroxypyruvate isomerase